MNQYTVYDLLKSSVSVWSERGKSCGEIARGDVFGEFVGL